MSFSNERQPQSGAGRNQPEIGANGKPVGYRNPPKRTQFTGSGNPGGRRKNPPPVDFYSVLVRVMESMFGDKQVAEMLIDGQVKKALLGDASAYDRLVNGYTLAKRLQGRNKQDHIADQAAAERLLGSMSDFITGTDPADVSSTQAAKKPMLDE